MRRGIRGSGLRSCRTTTWRRTVPRGPIRAELRSQITDRTSESVFLRCRSNEKLAPSRWPHRSRAFPVAPVTRENARAADPEIGPETGNSAELRTGECAEKFVQFAAEAERWENFGRWWIFRRRIGRRHGWRPEELQQNSGLLRVSF